jgi:hypothetical protein
VKQYLKAHREVRFFSSIFLPILVRGPLVALLRE